MNCALVTTTSLLWLSSSLLLNEVLYDPPGSDGGSEFVELLCEGDDGCPLSGVLLEFVNGGDLERPRTLWRGDGLADLAPGERLVLGESAVAAADTHLSLGLQNGPDALRLFRDGELLDAVAWGELEGVGEGAPAADVSSASLARVPDGHDGDDNAADFQPRPPTPGTPNSFDHAVALLELQTVPAWIQQAGWMTAEIELRYSGDLPVQEATLSIELDEGAPWIHALRGVAEERQIFEQDFAVDEGAHELRVRAWGEGSPPDSLRLALQVGVTGLVFSEVLPAPRAPEPEWIELRAEPGSEGDWALADRVSEPHGFTLSAEEVAGEFLLLSENCSALAAFRAIPEEVACLELEGGWVTLNNSPNEELGFADRIRLFDRRGAVVDEFSYGSEGTVPAGHSFERSEAAGAWLLSPGEPTPGRRNELSRARLPRGGLAVTPELFVPDEGPLQIVLRAGESLRRVEASVVDLSGETVLDLGGGVADGPYLRWNWTGLDARGRELPWGAYVVLVRAQSELGEARRWRSLIALGRRS